MGGGVAKQARRAGGSAGGDTASVAAVQHATARGSHAQSRQQQAEAKHLRAIDTHLLLVIALVVLALVLLLLVDNQHLLGDVFVAWCVWWQAKLGQ